MHTYTIQAISLTRSKLYTISSIHGFPARSDLTFLLPVEDKKYGDDLAVKYGLNRFEELVGLTFNSECDNFETAMESLLFGRYIESNPDWILNNLIIPALIADKEIESRGIKFEIIREYIQSEFDSGTVTKTNNYDYDGSKWITKVDAIISKHGIKISPCLTLPDLRIKGPCFYFDVNYGTKEVTYAFSPTRKIISRMEEE